ncbi:MAG: FkbM family methyltransferase [Candidatus Omnitrophica bacterium]|nr:FkbM family methyltransferase [Candidatus Omnitrophota bacterium]MBU1870174.1 FkbM family methyltransferase [Candidatus Omnitrophota bacterium]
MSEKFKFLNPISLAREILGILMEHKLKATNSPVRFRDWSGSFYWQYPGDDVRFNSRRRSVSDAQNVIRFVLSNIRKGSVCVDIGAHLGTVTVSLWKMAGLAGKVISVEADSSNAKRIRENLQLNNLPCEFICNAAMLDRKCAVQLRCFPESNGWQSIGDPSFARSHKSFTKEVAGMNFGDLVRMYSLDHIDFVKIDAEGAEVLILNGMRTFLEQKLIDRVVFEVNPLTLEGLGSTVSDLFNFWNGLDYKIAFLDNKGFAVELDFDWPGDLIGDCVATKKR